MDDMFNVQLSPTIPILVELTKENQELLRELMREIKELREVVSGRKLSCPYCKSENLAPHSYRDKNLPEQDERFSCIWSMKCLVCHKKCVCVADSNEGDCYYSLPYDYFSQEVKKEKFEYSMEVVNVWKNSGIVPCNTAMFTLSDIEGRTI